MNKLLPKLLLATLSTGIFSFIASVPVHAAASLYLSPASSSVAQGSSFSVSVRVNTGGDGVNAVQANLSYPVDKLDFLGISTYGTAFEIQAENTGGGGSIRIGRGHVGSVTGDQLVATITFKAKPSSGSATVGFTSGSAVVRTSDNKNIISGKSGGTYSFKAAPPPPPKPKPDKTAPKISNIAVTNIGLNTATVVWKTNEKATSVVEYGPTKKLGIIASSTKLLTSHKIALSTKILEPGTQFYYVVKSKDKAGNEAKSKLTSFKTKGYSVKIKVVDTQGKPLAGVKVTIIPGLEEATTDEDGFATFNDIALGTHAVHVEVGEQVLADSIEVTETTKPEDVQEFDVKVAAASIAKEESIFRVVVLSLLAILAVGAALLLWWVRKRLKIPPTTEKQEKPK